MMPDRQRNVAAVVERGPRRRWIRTPIAAGIAYAFHSQTGVVFALCWFAAFALILELEWLVRPGGPFRPQTYPDSFDRFAQAQRLLTAVLFGVFAIAQALSGSPVALACASFLIAGSVVTFVTKTSASQIAKVTMIATPVILITVILYAVWRNTHSLEQTLQLGIAALFMLTGGREAWTRLAAMVTAIAAAQGQAEEANQAKSDFLATMSHEIRTPLNGVLGMAQAMAVDSLSDPQRERLKVINQSGQALLTILSDVLDLAKIEAGKIELEQAPFDLQTLVEQVRQTFLGIADGKGLTFTAQIDPDAAGMWNGDVTRLRQILSNLISNALKFTDHGCVAITATCRDGGLRFVVEDTGPGVTKEQLPTLFKKFVQADASTTRRYGGTGLGLSICGELASLMGGTITADHVQPHGLRFTFDAPLGRLDGERPAAPNPIVAATNDHHRDDRVVRILAAEDHPVNRQVLALLLSQAGIDLHIVENGEQAVHAWRDSAPPGRDCAWDLILMDVQMPIMDGPTAARTIRAEERATGRAPIPIIALTANVMTHQIEGYRQAGMDIFVAKPILVEALLAGIETALAGSARSADQDQNAA